MWPIAFSVTEEVSKKLRFGRPIITIRREITASSSPILPSPVAESGSVRPQPDPSAEAVCLVREVLGPYPNGPAKAEIFLTDEEFARSQQLVGDWLCNVHECVRSNGIQYIWLDHTIDRNKPLSHHFVAYLFIEK
jgi:hypothetical protein